MNTDVGVPEVPSDPSSNDSYFKTLALLAIDTTSGPVYFIVEGSADSSDTAREMQDHKRYFYEEHTCPTNFIGDRDGWGIVNVYADGNRDPHGVFRFVRAVWMPQRYVDAKNEEEGRRHNMGWCPEDVLEDLFPQIIEGHPRHCIHQGKSDSEYPNVNSMSIGFDGSSTITSMGEYTYTHYVAPGEMCDHPDRVKR